MALISAVLFSQCLEEGPCRDLNRIKSEQDANSFLVHSEGVLREKSSLTNVVEQAE